MKHLLDIINKINETQAALRNLEINLSKEPDKLSLQLSYESLQNRYESLQSKFLSSSENSAQDVCTYRIIAEANDNYPILAFGSALKNFQKWFSITYDSIKTGPKKRGRINPEVTKETSLNFAFSYTGSLGVAMTIPSERLLFINDLQLAMKKTTEMLSATSREEVKHFVSELGPASIRSMYNWIDDHVIAGLGADISWITNNEVFTEVYVSYEKMKILKQTIEETSELEEEIFEARGWLVGADTSNHTFHLVFEDKEEIRGKMSPSIGDSYTVELPKLYTSKIKKISFINYSTDEEKIIYYLESLEKG